MSPASPLVHTAFYKFVQLPQADEVAQHLRDLLARDFEGINGSVIVAAEGINGMLAGELAMIGRIEQALHEDPVFTGAFAGMPFKRSECVTVPFRKLKVHVKKEIVPLGIEGVDARKTGINVSPQECR